MEDCSGWRNKRNAKRKGHTIVAASRFIVLLFCLNGTVIHFASAQPEREKEKIKAVILKETVSFMNVDHKSWSDQWLHVPYAYWTYADSSGSTFIDGWSAIDKTYESYFKDQKPSNAKITDEWIDVRLYGNAAYVRFIQKQTDNIDVDETSQVRVLEKSNGVWKIVHVGVVVKYPKR